MLCHEAQEAAANGPVLCHTPGFGPAGALLKWFKIMTEILLLHVCEEIL